MNISNNFSNLNYHNNNVAFQASLNINDDLGVLNKYAKRLPGIIEGFEAKTAKNSKSGDFLQVSIDSKKQEMLIAGAGLDGAETLVQANLIKGALENLLKKDDNAVINHLVRLFKVAQKNEEIWQSTMRFQNAVENKVKNNEFTGDADALQDYAFQAQKAVIKNLQKKDEFFAKNTDSLF